MEELAIELLVSLHPVTERMRRTGLKDRSETTSLRLVASDGEAYTYNNRINRLASVQEFRMVLKAIERGVSKDRLAAVLSVNTDNIRRKRRLLDGICADAASLLEDKHVSINSFDALRKMLPERQVEAAELMVAMNKYTVSYARTLLAPRPRLNWCLASGEA